MLRYTDHAVERFIEYWRPGMGFAEAEQTLRALIAGAARTKRNAIGTNARVYLAHTERGERICLVVRAGVVVTVLYRRSYESGFFESDLPPANSNAAPEHPRSLAEQRAAVVASLLADRTKERREKAEAIVSAWKAGQPVASKTVRRAAALLGLDERQLARIRVEGGPFAGVCIELGEGDSVEDVVARFRQAMSERLRRRGVG